jgi:predicted nucleic acid-binding protein
MRFWDASALVALCVKEPATDALRPLASDGIVAWSVSLVEMASAVERRTREGNLSAAANAVARVAIRELAGAWTEISALGPVRDRAVRLVATHPLRAADAMQLGAALVAVADRPAGQAFVCTDGRLRAAAGREGFLVLPEG